MSRQTLKRIAIIVFCCALTVASAHAKTLKFANPMPVSDKQGWLETIKPWGEAINARTNGKLKVKAYHSGALIKFAETPDSMEVGMADLAYFSTMFAPAYFPSWLFGGVLDPSNSPRGPLEGVMIANIMIDEFPSFRQELAKKNMMVLMHNATTMLALISKDKVPSISQLEGKRMRIFAGEFHAELTKLQEAAPVMTPWPDVYESLDKGIVDCMVTVITGMRDLKLYEVSKFLYLMKAEPDSHWVAPMNACYLTAFNTNSFKRLSVEHRTILLEEAKKAEERYATLALEKFNPEALAEMKNGGMEILSWPEADIEKWGELAKQVYAMAAEKMKAKGLPGEEMINRYLELTKTPVVDLIKLNEKAWSNRIEGAKKL